MRQVSADVFFGMVKLTIGGACGAGALVFNSKNPQLVNINQRTKSYDLIKSKKSRADKKERKSKISSDQSAESLHRKS